MVRNKVKQIICFLSKQFYYSQFTLVTINILSLKYLFALRELEYLWIKYLQQKTTFIINTLSQNLKNCTLLFKSKNRTGAKQY